MRSRRCLCAWVSLTVARKRLGKNPPIVAMQWLGRNVTAVTNTHATGEELLNVSLSMWSVSCQGKHASSSSQNFLFNFNNGFDYTNELSEYEPSVS
jgi:hypothetical protein